MNFSRRKLTHPLPPSPAFTWILASSTNITYEKGMVVAIPSNLTNVPVDVNLDDVDAPALELDRSLGLGEERVVAAHADIVAGNEFRAALTDENRTGLGRLPCVQLHPPKLGIAIPTVARRTLSFFMCHGITLCFLWAIAKPHKPSSIAGGSFPVHPFSTNFSGPRVY
jgi:hypothetical protein